MAKGKERHMFPGGNTSQGFFSYYDYVLPQEKAKRIYILKGGPGVGKSSFMKKIAAGVCREGCSIEYMHCSSDPSSFDGVVFPDKDVAIIDGTAPHVLDPKNPGAVDEIINLGQFWNDEGIIKNREKIFITNKETSRLFQRAYRYIQAAYSIYKDSEAIYSIAMNQGKANVKVLEVVDRVFKGIDISEVEGTQRHLFASAITPEGLVNYLPSLISTREIIVVEGNPGTGTERLLERVCSSAIERGLYTESFYCALNPLKLEHLIIPELDISITTSNKYHNADINPTLKINFNDLLDQDILRKYKEEIVFNQKEFELLLNKAVKTIHQAKEKHDELEGFYIPNMNYNEVQKCQEETLKRIIKGF